MDLGLYPGGLLSNKVKVIRNETAEEFLSLNNSSLRKDVTRNNLFLGVANQITDGSYDAEDPIFLTIYENDTIVGQGMNTDEDHNLLLTKMPEHLSKPIVEEFLEHRNEVSGVGGDQVISRFVAENLAIALGKSVRLRDHLGIYELNTLNMPKTNGAILLMQDDVSEELILEWTAEFVRECDLNPNIDPAEVAKKSLDRHKSNPGYRFLKNIDGDIVSMAVKHREFEDRATVSLVYTPPKFRRNGYGKIVTALLTKELLDGKYVQCNLNTDMKNPTSNKIYQEIGYEFIGESYSYSLE